MPEILEGPSIEPEEMAIETTPVYFAEHVLKLRALYDWQADVLTELETAGPGKVARITVSTPNGAGKSSALVATAALWWEWIHPRGKVVITTKDSKQLDNQVWPSITAHRSKFPQWQFIERLIRTPTGGMCVLFTTDEAGRAEGWHKLDDIDGPLLIIVDEAKSVPEDIFSAFDRCTINAIMYASSPGSMVGTFYDSHHKSELGFYRKKVGLRDCPHIPKDRIDAVIAKYGRDHPFTRSTLDGEFMPADGEMRFDWEGLEALRFQRDFMPPGQIGVLVEVMGTISFQPREDGWIWIAEHPRIGCEYAEFCDPNTCEQSEITNERDNSAPGVLRKDFIEAATGEIHLTRLAAALHWPGGVKWDSDVLAHRMDLMSKYYGRCIATVEANNFGSALIKELQALGVPLWQRTQVDSSNPNKQLKFMGFLTTKKTKEWWVEECAQVVRDKEIIIQYAPAVDDFESFVRKPDGTCGAIDGKHDDWVAGIGICLVTKAWKRMQPPPRVQPRYQSGENFQELTGRGSLGIG